MNNQEPVSISRAREIAKRRALLLEATRTPIDISKDGHKLQRRAALLFEGRSLVIVAQRSIRRSSEGKLIGVHSQLFCDQFSERIGEVILSERGLSAIPPEFVLEGAILSRAILRALSVEIQNIADLKKQK